MPGSYLADADLAALNGAGVQSINPKGFSGGGQVGYNWQFGKLVVGVEADLDYLHLNGSANSGAVAYALVPFDFFVVSSYAHSDWLLTARSRLGYAANNWLFYATGGLAVANLKGDVLFTDSFNTEQSASVSATKLGYAVGAGVEWGITDRLSVKGEYLHVGFGRTAIGQTSTSIPNQTFNQSETLRADTVRLGLNYRFGNGGSDVPVRAPVLDRPLIEASNWELETGSRIWLSSGRIGAPNPLLNTYLTPPSPVLASRLIFSGLDGISGETFARLDHSSGLFFKGILGAGAVNRGKLNDEDFPVSVYSNTLSSASGHIAYATADVGYSFLRTAAAKLGVFVGYNYYEEDINTYGCQQLAGDPICRPPNDLPAANLLIIAQDGHYHSLRVGLSSEFMLTDKLKFTADAAYLPRVNFTGQDDHTARQLLLPEASSRGDGVMVEAVLGYSVTSNWNVGVGGRYWAYNMRTGTTTFNQLGVLPQATFIEPVRLSSERYGMFVQSSYKWGGPPAAVTASAAPLKATAAVAPMNWSGFYVGGHIGGGVSDSRWSDPFGSTFGFFGYTNVAGFGDHPHGGGPLAGVQVGADMQTGKWVLGIQGDFSAARLRGEDTCFSGIGGVNCKHVVREIDTVAARVGYAWDRSLVYAKAGRAWTDTNYNVLGNTNAQSLGTGSTSVTTAGWIVGGGLEYALTDNWTTVAEYNHIGTGDASLSFPNVNVVNAQNINVKQSIDLFKLGVNYKFARNGTIVINY